jgi:hypothetical protein
MFMNNKGLVYFLDKPDVHFTFVGFLVRSYIHCMSIKYVQMAVALHVIL